MIQINRTSDSSEGNVENDPMSQASSGLEAPSFPLLQPDRIYEMKISKCAKKPTAKDPSREMLEITVETTKDNVGTRGENLHPGYKGFTYIGITATDGSDGKRARTKLDIAKDVAMILKAVGKGNKSPIELIANPSMVEGEIVQMKVGIQKGKDGYGDKNVFNFVLP